MFWIECRLSRRRCILPRRREAGPSTPAAKSSPPPVGMTISREGRMKAHYSVHSFSSAFKRDSPFLLPLFIAPDRDARPGCDDLSHRRRAPRRLHCPSTGQGGLGYIADRLHMLPVRSRGVAPQNFITGRQAARRRLPLQSGIVLQRLWSTDEHPPEAPEPRPAKPG